MDTLEVIVRLWPIYAVASAAIVWYSISEARDRAKRACDEWEAMMIGRESDSDQIPDVPKHRVWDIYVYYWFGAILGIFAFLCAALTFLEFIAVSILPAQ